MRKKQIMSTLFFAFLGKMGITGDVSFPIPLDPDSEDDKEAAEWALQFYVSEYLIAFV